MSNFRTLALVAGTCLALCGSASAAQADNKAKGNPPAAPQAKTIQPATHFTQGTIASIDANKLVINQKIRGKEQQATFTLNAQTQRNGSLTTGTRVSVQYREDKTGKTATAVRDTPVKSEGKPAKDAGSKPGSKS